MIEFSVYKYEKGKPRYSNQVGTVLAEHGSGARRAAIKQFEGLTLENVIVRTTWEEITGIDKNYRLKIKNDSDSGYINCKETTNPQPEKKMRRTQPREVVYAEIGDAVKHGTPVGAGKFEVSGVVIHSERGTIHLLKEDVKGALNIVKVLDTDGFKYMITIDGAVIREFPTLAQAAASVSV
jgi:hypothetical protein